ncbi:MAG: 4'-phosphopantetheinyl transferase superfamily protein [Bacteroides sp.]
MAIYQQYKEGNLHRGIWRIEESVDELLSLCSKPELYRASLAAFSSDKRRQEWLSVRILLSVLCGEEKEITYLPNGKPYLVDDSYHISISHTRGYVAVILHPTEEVGIDIEQHSNRVGKVRSKFMQPSEENQLVKANEICHLLLHWSAKETIYKLLGNEEVELLRDIHIEAFVPEKEGSFIAKSTQKTRAKQHIVHYQVYSDFVMTYVVSS